MFLYLKKFVVLDVLHVESFVQLLALAWRQWEFVKHVEVAPICNLVCQTSSDIEIWLPITQQQVMFYNHLFDNGKE